ncbi:hypothetical protein [Sulfitobacter sabulilitoris]|uniref:Uncharacterized protein n=1 Tax=Sulfitobacter sabulilitoris TaxID=2562655 RepID=A0A5S3PCB4_9RHOB|nr:hypothetical protein [Sulfitobacter sabulilitoris]TMM51227.1 hypothetical protein FDT80_15325 [Sulfitobacter sabulilitoris]
MNVKFSQLAVLAALAGPLSAAERRHAYLEDGSGARIEIATIDIASDGAYAVTMTERAFSDHFLSMRPFKCVEGPEKTWCHVPYPYTIRRDISTDLTDLEYDFLFVWKGKGDYGINMWNGVYYRMARSGDALRGVLHELDMDLLASPPAADDLRPLGPQDIVESDPDSHWLPRLIIE